VVFGLPLVGLALFPATPAPLRTLVLWLTPPFLAHAFVIGFPRTHFYTLHIPAALLAALAVAGLVHWLAAHRLGWLRLPLAVAGGAVLLLAVPYAYLLYLQQNPEYYRTFPRERPAIYQARYGDAVPGGGHFGFPHRDGWKVAGMLYQQGELQGSISSNQSHRTDIWYIRGAPTCDHAPETVFLATWGGTNLDLHMPRLNDADSYARVACVLVEDQRMMDIYTRQPAAQPARPLHLADYRAAFDATPLPAIPLQDTLNATLPQHAHGQHWQQGITLAGYDLPYPQVAPGEHAPLTLYWDVTAPPATPYTPVVELYDTDGILVGTARRLCPGPPASEWLPEVLHKTSFAVHADADLPPGRYELRVSLRHPETGAALPLTDGRSAAEVGSITVERE
jgi:hypothetical protein